MAHKSDNTQEAIKWRLYCCTFNLNAKWTFDKTVAHCLLKKEAIEDTDMISLGFQEAPMSAASISGYGIDPVSPITTPLLASSDFVQLLPVVPLRQMGIMLIIYVKRKHLSSIKSVACSNYRSGDIADVVGNKGAVACQITLFGGTKVTFLTCHFSPQSEGLAKRLQEYRSIDQQMTFGSAPKPCWNDYVIWTGDFNFRVNYHSIQATADLLASNKFADWKVLLDYDQLTKCRKQNEVFPNFYEGDITFKPTYRYLINSSEYDTLRHPSWCDRVLWSVRELIGSAPGRPSNLLSCRLVEYDSLDEVLISDHKPVYAKLDINICYRDVCDVWPVTFSTNNTVWFVGQPNICKFRMDDDERQSRSVWDWVAVYKEGFGSTHDYVTYMTLITSWDDADGSSKLLFKGQYLSATTGKHRLGYFSSSRKCLIGLSDPFEIVDSKGIDSAIEATE